MLNLAKKEDENYPAKYSRYLPTWTCRSMSHYYSFNIHITLTSLWKIIAAFIEIFANESI